MVFQRIVINSMGKVMVGPLDVFLGLIILVLIGSIIIFIVGALIFFIPAFIVAGVVLLFTGDNNLAGIAFLVIAILSFTKRK
jgi:hypothetical protein